MPETGELLRKLQAFCASRERCTSEVRAKLDKLGATPSQTGDIIPALQADSFLDEKRYCAAFVRQATEIKKLGKRRIFEELQNREIKESSIMEAISAMTDESQKELLKERISTETGKVKDPTGEEYLAKLIRKLSREGFEGEDILEMIRLHFNIDILKKQHDTF